MFYLKKLIHTSFKLFGKEKQDRERKSKNWGIHGEDIISPVEE
jgi:hypothetical protein